MKIIKYFVTLLCACSLIQPVYAIDDNADYSNTNESQLLDIFIEDLDLFYEGVGYEFQDSTGNNITNIIFSYKNQYYEDKETTALSLLEEVGSYGQLANIELTSTNSKASYTWKKYKIILSLSAYTQVDICVSAQYNQSTKKIEKPTYTFKNIVTSNNYNLYSKNAVISYKNNGKTIHYAFTVNHIFKTENQIKTNSFSKDWTPNF